MPVEKRVKKPFSHIWSAAKASYKDNARYGEQSVPVKEEEAVKVHLENLAAEGYEAIMFSSTELPHDTTKYQGTIFHNKKTNCFLIASAGTRVREFEDLMADMEFSSNEIPKKYYAAREMNESLMKHIREHKYTNPPPTFEYIGHSLGALMSQLLSVDMVMRQQDMQLDKLIDETLGSKVKKDIQQRFLEDNPHLAEMQERLEYLKKLDEQGLTEKESVEYNRDKKKLASQMVEQYKKEGLPARINELILQPSINQKINDYKQKNNGQEPSSEEVEKYSKAAAKERHKEIEEESQKLIAEYSKMSEQEASRSLLSKLYQRNQSIFDNALRDRSIGYIQENTKNLFPAFKKKVQGSKLEDLIKLSEIYLTLEEKNKLMPLMAKYQESQESAAKMPKRRGQPSSKITEDLTKELQKALVGIGEDFFKRAIENIKQNSKQIISSETIENPGAKNIVEALCAERGRKFEDVFDPAKHIIVQGKKNYINSHREQVGKVFEKVDHTLEYIASQWLSETIGRKCGENAQRVFNGISFLIGKLDIRDSITRKAKSLASHLVSMGEEDLEKRDRRYKNLRAEMTTAGAFIVITSAVVVALSGIAAGATAGAAAGATGGTLIAPVIGSVSGSAIGAFGGGVVGFMQGLEKGASLGNKIRQAHAKTIEPVFKESKKIIHTYKSHKLNDFERAFLTTDNVIEHVTSKQELEVLSKKVDITTEDLRYNFSLIKYDPAIFGVVEREKIIPGNDLVKYKASSSDRFVVEYEDDGKQVKNIYKFKHRELQKKVDKLKENGRHASSEAEHRAALEEGGQTPLVQGLYQAFKKKKITPQSVRDHALLNNTGINIRQ